MEQLSVSMKCLACCLQLSQKVKHPHQQVTKVLRRSQEILVLMPIYSFTQRSCTTALHAMLVACMPFKLHTYCHAPSWRYVYTPAGLSARHDAHNTVYNICSRARAPPVPEHNKNTNKGVSQHYKMAFGFNKNRVTVPSKGIKKWYTARPSWMHLKDINCRVC